tara:strand:- start:68510 stop:69631 length:1122 start_codon:yes stop_codon:yes gene_type:complete
MSAFNIKNKWDPLEVVVLGNNYSADFYKDIKNTNIRSAMQQIADETLEDIENYKQKMTEHGVKVLQVELDRKDSIMNYINSEGQIIGNSNWANNPSLPYGPLEPRNHYFVLNQHLFCTHYSNDNMKQTIDNYSKENQVRLVDNQYAAPNYTVINNDLLIDTDAGDPHPWFTQEIHTGVEDYNRNVKLTKFSMLQNKTKQRWELIHDDNIKTIQEYYPNQNIIQIDEGGHSDGVFHTISPGVMLSINDVDFHKKLFPDWDVLYLPDESWDKVGAWTFEKSKIDKSYWVPGQEDNEEFNHFVKTWLSDWVGYCTESVFDVNVLVLDPHTVCINNKNPLVIDFLKKHKIDYIHVPWRHRYFWDGGLHCITLDLKRR